MASTTDALLALTEWIETNALKEEAKKMLDGRLRGQVEGLCREFKAMEERARFAEEKLLAFEKANERLSIIADKQAGALGSGLAIVNKITQGRGNSHSGHPRRQITASTPNVIEVCGTCTKDKCRFGKQCHNGEKCKFCHCHSE